jgi:hypothetical protein
MGQTVAESGNGENLYKEKIQHRNEAFSHGPSSAGVLPGVRKAACIRGMPQPSGQE